MNNHDNADSTKFSKIDEHPTEEHEAKHDNGQVSQYGDSGKSWDALDVDDKARKEAILLEHFPKAFERFKAGVSLAKIRKHYAALGASYSPVTFVKKWNEMVKNIA